MTPPTPEKTEEEKATSSLDASLGRLAFSVWRRLTWPILGAVSGCALIAALAIPAIVCLAMGTVLLLRGLEGAIASRVHPDWLVAVLTGAVVVGVPLLVLVLVRWRLRSRARYRTT